MNKYYDVGIIGAGASGMFTALKLSQKGLKVLVLEGNAKPCKKLLATGNGKCNLCNTNINLSNFHGDTNEISILINKFKSENITKEFEALGIFTFEDSEGRIYPKSLQASSVARAICDCASENKCEIICDFTVTKIQKDKDLFTIYSDNKAIICKSLVVATGSPATPKLSCKSEINSIIKNFGHKFIDFTPSLTAFMINDKMLKNLAGVRSKARVSILKNNKTIYSENGEIIFSDKSISGICIFNLSSRYEKKQVLHIDLLPEKTDLELYEILVKTCKNRPKMSSADVLNGLLNMKLGLELIKKIGIDFKNTANNISDIQLKKLAYLTKNLKFEIDNIASLENAQVAKGGVPLAEIDMNTMQSKIVPHLYFTGEILNINGDCGGYNLYFAWATAIALSENFV